MQGEVAAKIRLRLKSHISKSVIRLYYKLLHYTMWNLTLPEHKEAAINKIIVGVCHYKDCSQLENLLFMKNNAVYTDQQLTDGLACIKYDSVFSAPLTLKSLLKFSSIFVSCDIFWWYSFTCHISSSNLPTATIPPLWKMKIKKTRNNPTIKVTKAQQINKAKTMESICGGQQLWDMSLTPLDDIRSDIC